MGILLNFTDLQIAGQIEGDILVYISPLFSTCHCNMGYAYKLVSVR